jgi:hypothetical protein
MNKQFVSLLLLLALVIGISAQKADVVDQNLRTNVAYLTSDALEGRRVGEQGSTAAAGYIANLFSQFKLKPGVVSTADGKPTRGFLQKFPYTTGVTIAPEGNEFKLAIRNAGNVAVEDQTPVRPMLSSPNAAAENAPIVFGGYGIDAPESRFLDYEGLEATGKVVIAFDGNPDNDSPRSPFARFSVHAKAKLAKDKGAVALLLISREEKFENDRNVAAKYEHTAGETAIPVFAVSRTTAANILGIAAGELRTVESIVALRQQTTARIRLGFRDLAPVVSFKTNLVKQVTDAYNVVGILEGTDPKLKEEAIVIGAHYDHLGRGGRESLAVNSTEIHHGADDNASGTAAMLELARQYAKEKKNKRTLIFIGFGAEEVGLIGSKFYVNNPLFPLEKTVAMMNMDMVGRLKDEKLNVGGIGTAAEWRELVTRKNEVVPPVYDKPKKSSFAPNAPESVSRFTLQLNEDGFGPSDHSSFYSKQIPVLFFFTGTHVDYHKPSDTADKINYDGLKRIVEYVKDITNYVDQSANRPVYKVAQSQQQGDGRRGFAVTIGVVPGYGEANDGMLLDGVRDGGPAALAGIKGGDKIIRFAGKEIRNVQDYTFVLGELKADTEYEIVVRRGNETLTLKVKPTARR